MLLIQLMNNQLKNINENDVFVLSDLKRILKYSELSIFQPEACVLWTGYITFAKVRYINFYFKGRKQALIRLLYKNFIGNLDDSTYLSHTCKNPSNCINLNHIKVKKTINQNVFIKKPTPKIIYFD